MNTRFKIFLLMLAASLWLGLGTAAAADLKVELTPNVVEIGTFYNGTTVKVSGEVPAAAEVVVRLSGEGEDLHLKKKGKVAGLLWMNTDDLIFHNAPKVYKLYTGKGIGDLQKSAARSFGFTALKDRIEIAPADSDSDFLLKEFVRMRSKDALYSLDEGAVTYGPLKNGMKTFTVDVAVPSRMTQGQYGVAVAAVQDGHVIGTASKTLALKQVGIPSKISTMAFGHALWYGIMAVVIAVMAGLIMGLLFKDKGGAH